MNSWTLGSVLSWATKDFKKRGFENPRLEAEVLLAHALGLNRLDLYLGFEKPLNQNELANYKEAIVKRRSGLPVAYISGFKEFWSLQMKVDDRVLIPRPETEFLVEAAIARTPEDGVLLDLCTGSGCVAVAVARELKELTVDVTDISNDALEVAKENISIHGLDDRIFPFHGNLFDPIKNNNKKYNIITANPPYVIDEEISHLAPEVQKEPRLALAGGPDGLDIVRRIVKEAPSLLEEDGWLLIEVDPRQVKPLIDTIGPSSFEEKGEVIQDLSGADRVVAWKKSSGGTQCLKTRD